MKFLCTRLHVGEVLRVGSAVDLIGTSHERRIVVLRFDQVSRQVHDKFADPREGTCIGRKTSEPVKAIKVFESRLPIPDAKNLSYDPGIYVQSTNVFPPAFPVCVIKPQ